MQAHLSTTLVVILSLLTAEAGAQGVAVVAGEFESGVTGVAVPVGSKGAVRAVLGVSDLSEVFADAALVEETIAHAETVFFDSHWSVCFAVSFFLLNRHRRVTAVNDDLGARDKRTGG